MPDPRHRCLQCLSRNAASQIPLPAPGTPAQIARALAAAPLTHRLPTDITQLHKIHSDKAENTWLGKGCVFFRCDWGKHSKPLVILIGDSHADMWSPAVARAVINGGGHLKMIWDLGCPVAKVHFYGTFSNPQIYDTACDAWRNQTLAEVRHLHPSLVLLSERTTNLFFCAQHPCF